MASNVKLTKAQIDLLLNILDVLGTCGLHYQSGHFGRRRYNPETGEAYFTEPRSSEVTLYGPAADLLARIVGKEARELAAALRAITPAGLEALREVEGR